MADPVLRIPVDDEAFRRYMEAFQRYQTQLGEQPEMWEETNAATRDGVAANLALADAIGASVSAAVRLGDVQEQNAQKRKRNAEEENAEAVRSASWRRKALDHVQELSRTTASVVRGLGSFAAGSGTGGLFGGISSLGKELGGTLGGIVNLAGEALNANYIANNAVSDKGQFARGIGATIAQQEGFHTQLGRFTNTDQGIDAVMNARGSANERAPFYTLGVDYTKGSNADVYAKTLRAQVALAERHTDKNGNIKFYETDPRGGSAMGTSHEDLNRLVAADRAGKLDKAIKEAQSFKTPIDKQIDSATASATATDKLTTVLTDKTQSALVGLNVGMDKLTGGMLNLTTAVTDMYNLLSFKWIGGTSTAAPGANAAFAKEHPWLAWLGFAMKEAPHAAPPGAQNNGASARSMATVAPGSNPALSQAVAAIEGIGGRVSSTHRTRAEQAQLYAKYQAFLHGGKWAAVAAPPGYSAHETGDAVDIRYSHGVSKASIAAALDKAGIKHRRVIDEGDHYHVSLIHQSSGRTNGGHAANVNVNVKVTVPPGHQPAVVANSAANGSARSK